MSRKNSSKNYLTLKSWGTMTNLSSTQKKSAKVLLGGPEIHRLLALLREYEEKKENVKPEIVEALQLLEKNYFNNSPDPIEAEVPVDKRSDLKQ